MDPITHALLGACASQACFAKKLGRHAPIVGALAGMAPDLDILIHSNQNPLIFFLYHRQFTHSLLFIPVGGLIVGILYLLFIRSSRQHKAILLCAAVIGYGTHGLLDSITSYGTVLFWPFSYMRVALDFMPIIEPFFTLILAVAVIWSWRKRSTWPAIIGLILSLGYIGFGAWQHHRAVLEFKTHIKQSIHNYQVMPEVARLNRWRAVYSINQCICVMQINLSLIEKAKSNLILCLPKATLNNTPKFISNNPLNIDSFNSFEWFTNGLMASLPDAPNILVDMRFIRSFNPIIVLWSLEFIPNISYPKFHRNLLIPLAKCN